MHSSLFCRFSEYVRYSLREPFHFAVITQQGASTVKERRELLEAHRHNVALELQATQQTATLIDATIAQYRRLNVNR